MTAAKPDGWIVADPFDGVYSGQHTASALSLWAQTMTGGWLGAQMTTQSWPGHYLNAYLVFDYQDAGNYKYAGMADGGPLGGSGIPCRKALRIVPPQGGDHGGMEGP